MNRMKKFIEEKIMKVIGPISKRQKKFITVEKSYLDSYYCRLRKAQKRLIESLGEKL